MAFALVCVALLCSALHRRASPCFACKLRSTDPFTTHQPTQQYRPAPASNAQRLTAPPSPHLTKARLSALSAHHPLTPSLHSHLTVQIACALRNPLHPELSFSAALLYRRPAAELTLFSLSRACHRMAEQQSRERERRRLTKRITNSSTSNISPISPASQFSGRNSSFSDHRISTQSSSDALPYAGVYQHRPSNSRHQILAGVAPSSSGALAYTTGRVSLAEPDALLGRPFDGQNLIKEISDSYSVAQNSSYRVNPTSIPTSAAAAAASASLLPGVNPQSIFRPPYLTHAKTLDERLLSPKLRPSQSLAALSGAVRMERITPPRNNTNNSSSSGYVSPRQRYSDEAKPDKKKNVFANFLNGVKASPRRPTISTPTNPMHVTHVGIDNETGQYTVSACSSSKLQVICH